MQNTSFMKEQEEGTGWLRRSASAALVSSQLSLLVYNVETGSKKKKQVASNINLDSFVKQILESEFGEDEEKERSARNNNKSNKEENYSAFLYDKENGMVRLLDSNKALAENALSNEDTVLLFPSSSLPSITEEKLSIKTRVADSTDVVIKRIEVDTDSTVQLVKEMIALQYNIPDASQYLLSYRSSVLNDAAFFLDEIALRDENSLYAFDKAHLMDVVLEKKKDSKKLCPLKIRIQLTEDTDRAEEIQMEVDYSEPLRAIHSQICSLFEVSSAAYHLYHSATGRRLSQQLSLAAQGCLPHSSLLVLSNKEHAVLSWTEEPDEPQYIRFTTDHNNNTILLAASLNKLIERLTDPTHHDLMFMKVFLLTLRSFTTPEIFLAKLVQRYHIAQPSNMSKEQFEKTIQKPIQLRVCNVLKNWLLSCFGDFNDKLLLQVNDFLENTLNTDGHASLAKKLADTIAKQQSTEKKKKKQFTTPAPPPKIPRNLNSSSLNFLDVDEEEIARQLTLLEFDIFAAIKPTECLNQAWTKPQLQHLSPNLLTCIERFNNAENVKTRVKVMAKFITIAKHLQKLCNYQTMTAFVAGFNNAAIQRLALTKKELPTKLQEDLAQLEKMISSEGNYKAYRHCLHASNPPLIPYIGVYLSDLLHIEENPDNIDHLINFQKRTLVCKVILEIVDYQQQPYNLKALGKIQALFKKLPTKPDKELYELSLVREPRK